MLEEKSEPVEKANIYAAPASAADPELIKQAKNRTTYLEHDGYSEDQMLLCNEHFITPDYCILSGEKLDSPGPAESRCVSRYLPSFRESKNVKLMWLVQFVLFACCITALIFGYLPVALFMLTFMSVANVIMKHRISEKIVLSVFLSDEVVKKRRKISQFLLLSVVLTSGLVVHQIFSLIESPYSDAGIYFLLCYIVNTILFKVFMSYKDILKYKNKKGDFYYLSGPHPHFLATQPLRDIEVN